MHTYDCNAKNKIGKCKVFRQIGRDGMNEWMNSMNDWINEWIGSAKKLSFGKEDL